MSNSSEKTVLIVGLGNPGDKYKNTRHNIGFMALDGIASVNKLDFKLWGNPKRSDLSIFTYQGTKVILLKPITYMNLSGEAVLDVAQFYKISPENICVLHDELDLEQGDLRLKIGGGDGGHNGLKSITQKLGTSNYSRIRMGIGRPPHPDIDAADYVLSSFRTQDWPAVDSMIQLATQAITAFAESSNAFKLLMNTFNRKEKR